MDNSIGVIVTSFKRPHTIVRQLSSMAMQSVEPSSVTVFHNFSSDGRFLAGFREKLETYGGQSKVQIESVFNSFNTGVWARFAWPLYALDTRFVMILDDDTVPGNRWIENCLSCFDRHPGVYGANGVIFKQGDRSRREYHGCANLNGDACKQVDIVGHAWFFERKLLRAFCGFDRARSAEGNTCGEDYHLAFAAQKFGLNCYVPPHPVEAGREEFWGSLHVKLGTDDVALYRQPGEEEKKLSCHNEYIARGWKPLELQG